MAIKAFKIDFNECDQRHKNRLNDWLDVLYTVSRYAERDGLEDFSSYLKRIHFEVSTFYPTYIVPKSKVRIFDYLGGEGCVAVTKSMKNKLTSSELEDANKWLLNLQKSDFFTLLGEHQRKFKLAMKNKSFYSNVEKNHLTNTLNLIKQSIEHIIQNI